MKKVFSIVLLSILMISCEKQKVLLIQAKNYNQNGVKAFYGVNYILREEGATIKEGLLDKDEHDYIQINMKPFKNYSLTINPPKDMGKDYERPFSFDIDENTESLFFNYAMRSNLLLTVNSPNQTSFTTGNIYVKKKWLTGRTDEEKKEETILDSYINDIPIKRIKNMNEGEYEISWDINLDGIISSSKDTIQLIYGDTIHYTINF